MPAENPLCVGFLENSPGRTPCVQGNSSPAGPARCLTEEIPPRPARPGVLSTWLGTGVHGPGPGYPSGGSRVPIGVLPRKSALMPCSRETVPACWLEGSGSWAGRLGAGVPNCQPKRAYMLACPNPACLHPVQLILKYCLERGINGQQPRLPNNVFCRMWLFLL